MALVVSDWLSIEELKIMAVSNWLFIKVGKPSETEGRRVDPAEVGAGEGQDGAGRRGEDCLREDGSGGGGREVEEGSGAAPTQEPGAGEEPGGGGEPEYTGHKNDKFKYKIISKPRLLFP